ncbi:MAG: transposase [Sedimentisphaerales bacterium]|nr:transposase [Sedimentisphaerales bacterium]
MGTYRTVHPESQSRTRQVGRPPQDRREVLNGILWILRTGAPWADLPERYPPRSTCHRCFQAWSRSGVFAKILTALAEDLRDRGGIDLSEGFIDGTFAPAKKGAMAWARPNGAKAPKSWALQTLMVFLSKSCEILGRHTYFDGSLEAGELQRVRRRWRARHAGGRNAVSSDCRAHSIGGRWRDERSESINQVRYVKRRDQPNVLMLHIPKIGEITGFRPHRLPCGS